MYEIITQKVVKNVPNGQVDPVSGLALYDVVEDSEGTLTEVVFTVDGGDEQTTYIDGTEEETIKEILEIIASA